MAVKNYLFYSAEVDENSGAQSSVLNLYSDANGTPLTTGTLIASYAGSGPNLGVEEVGGEVRPNKTAWTETMSGAGGTLEVAVADAGTGSAEIRFTYGGTEMRFDASRLAFTRSTNYPSLYAYNRDRAAAEPAGAQPSDAPSGSLSPGRHVRGRLARPGPGSRGCISARSYKLGMAGLGAAVWPRRD